MIIAAALRYDRVILSIPVPARHGDILHAIYHQFGDYDLEQGFLTDKGEFLDRKEAMKHAVLCGQGTPRRDVMAREQIVYQGPELYSEDLW